tara:strand:- start:252 stop:590 length:339 start_codon:yes stop_codon:yes gene_type:complete
MTTWNYTKKIVMDNKTAEGCLAHENAFNLTDGLQDWYFAQADAGLVDPTRLFLPSKKLSDTVYEILVTDQAQAESFLAATLAVAEKIGFPLSDTIVDVDYTTDTIPDDFDVS